MSNIDGTLLFRCIQQECKHGSWQVRFNYSNVSSATVYKVPWDEALCPWCGHQGEVQPGVAQTINRPPNSGVILES